MIGPKLDASSSRSVCLRRWSLGKPIRMRTSLTQRNVGMCSTLTSATTRKRGTMELPGMIPNASLLPVHVPNWSPTELDPIGFNSGVVDDRLGENTAEWLDIWTFALTFDGYRYFGGDDSAAERLSDFTSSIEASFDRNSELPRIDLAFLRACLFSQQRFWLKWGGAMTRECPPRTAEYLEALLNATRNQIST